MATTIPELVDEAAERFPEGEALVEGSLRLTFPQLRDEVRNAASAVVGLGVRPGDRVAIWAPNSAEWAVAGLGVLAAGGVIVPLNTRFKGEEAAYILGKSGARVVLTVGEFLGVDYGAMLRDAGVDAAVVPIDDDTWRRGAAEAALPDVAAGDLSDVLFTSGTTGKPKGVMITHEQSLRAFESWSEVVGLAEGDRYLVVMPFFHTFGWKAGVLACLMRGATVIPLPVLDMGELLRAVEDERVTMLPGAPTLYQTILEHPEREKYDLSSLRLAVTGAAVVPVELIRRMRDELTFRTIITGYGLTEATGIATMCRHDDDPETIANTSGRAIPDVEVRVVDDDGAEVPRGQPGEVVVRGYNVMRGYWDDAGATAEAIDGDGWLHTGDVGVMDEAGYIRITDRKKDMFIVGGFNAYPAEIEGSLLEHPSVAQVAVVGVPDERMGEVGRAFVVPRSGATVDPDELVAWARERMANYKVPRSVEVVDALPMNASGKVLKYELRGRG